MADQIMTYEYATVNFAAFKKGSLPNTKQCMTKQEVNRWLSVEQSPLTSYVDNRLVPIVKIIGKVIQYSCPSSTGQVTDLKLQSDGKKILVGAFSIFNGNNTSKIVRLNVDGTFDNTFNTGYGFDGLSAYSICIQSNGRILVGGLFNSYNESSAVGKFVPITTNGNYDTSTALTSGVQVGNVRKVLLSKNDKVFIGGSISNYNGVTITTNIIKLNADLSRDTTFNSTISEDVYDIIEYANGKVLVNGSKLLNANGTLDTTFANINNNYSDVVTVLQPDGKVLIGGSAFNGYSAITRINANGTFDTSFTSGLTATNYIKTIKLLPDGKILIGGTLAGTMKNIRRLNPNGTIDATFSGGSGFNNTVSLIELNENGKLIISGEFTSYNGYSRQKFLYLNYDGDIIACYVGP